MRKGSLGLVLALALFTLAPLGFAQKPPKKGAKPAAAPAASDSATAAPAPADTPPTSAAAGDAPSASASADATASAKTHEEVKADEELGKGSMTDVEEKSGKAYYFVGLRYRGTIIPKFMINLFVDEGATFYTNSMAVELDMRKDDFSIIPAIGYGEYGTGGQVLFLQKGKDPGLVGNYSYVDSSLKSINLTIDLLKSIKVHKNIDFEFGAGFGLYFMFGDLITNWVQKDPAGTLVASNGQHFSPCQTVGAPGSGCNAADHQNSSVNKVGGYTEPSWVNGGSKPNVFLHLAFPELGLRIKPIKQFEGRVQIGFSLTGFFFGLNGAYGLEEQLEKKK